MGQSTCGHLEYNRFSIVWFHFLSVDTTRTTFAKSSIVTPIDSDIDRQVLDADFLRIPGLLQRYRLAGFDIQIKLSSDEPEPTLRGRVHVEAANFFGNTIGITYRIVAAQANDYCWTSRRLTSDDLILLAGLPIGIEHWHVSSGEKKKASIDYPVASVCVSNLLLDEYGADLAQPAELRGSKDAILDLMSRYANLLRGSVVRTKTNSVNDSAYVLIDVWEDVQHAGTPKFDFSAMTAPEIVTHIESAHREELMGLLTLYPFEWPYRDSGYFERVCGDNIAIDTDDLVLVSDCASIIIGAYGLRGSGAPTDWTTVFDTRRLTDNVCWPEYLGILEFALAKQHTVNDALTRLVFSSRQDVGRTNLKDMIKQNSILAIRVNSLLLTIDAMRFSRFASHRMMYRLTEQRLGLDREYAVLTGAVQQLDASVKNVDGIEELRRSRIVRGLLGFITIASVFQVVFQQLPIPIVERFYNKDFAQSVGSAVIVAVILGLVIFGGGAVLLLLWREVAKLREARPR